MAHFPWTTVTAVAALAVSLFTLARSELRNRRAGLLVRWEGQASRGTYDDFVIHNAGPAIARGVGFRIVAPDGSDLQRPISFDGEDSLPLLALPSSHEHRLRYVRRMMEYPPAAEVVWRDGRRRQQRMVVPLSRAVVGSSIVVNVTAEVQPEPPQRGRTRY